MFPHFGLQLMKAIGNGNANLFWEHDLLPIQKPTKDSLPEDRKKFTQLKYQQRRYSNQHSQAHNKKMLNEVGFYRSNQHTQAHNKKLLNDVGFYSQTGLLLQPACTGTQQENAQ